MPIAQLMQKLSARSERRTDRMGPSLEFQRSICEPMDCSRSFEVVAEVRPVSPGSLSGSMCSGSSEAGGSPTHMRQQASTGLGGRMSSSSSAALLASSLPGTLFMANAHCKQSTERALRARGKAMLRTEGGLPTADTSTSLELMQQLSMESSSSMSILDAVMSTGVASPRFTRSSTAPLPGSLRATGPGSLADPRQHSAAAAAAAAGSSKAALQVLPAAVNEAVSEDEDDLVHPISPAMQAQEEEHDHCHWEDGVIAGWLQGVDHSELLHDSDDEDDTLQQPDVLPSAAAPAAAGVTWSKGEPDHCHWEDGVIAGWLQGVDHSELLHDSDDEDDADQRPAAVRTSCIKEAAAAHPLAASVYSSSLYN